MPIMFVPGLALTAVKGIIDYSEAKKITSEAEKRYKIKMIELDDNHERMVKTLTNLGKLKVEIYEEFDRFLCVIEKIHNRPILNYKMSSSVNLPQLDIDKLRETMGKVSKVSVKDFASFAASGVKLALLVPIPGINLLLSGMLVLGKGKKMKREAESKLDKAKEMEESIDHLILQMMEIRKCTNSFYMTLYDTKRFYDRYLDRFIDSIERGRKQDWDELSTKEILMVSNLAFLIAILHKMCQVELIKETQEIGDSPLDKDEIENAVKKMGEAISEVEEKERSA